MRFGAPIITRSYSAAITAPLLLQMKRLPPVLQKRSMQMPLLAADLHSLTGRWIHRVLEQLIPIAKS